MKISYDRQSLVNGQKMRQMNEESPGEIATYNGADMTTGTGGGLAARNEVRKAGPGGVHAMRLMNDPGAAAQTNTWMEQFGENQLQALNSMQLKQLKLKTLQHSTLPIKNSGGQADVKFS